MIAAPKFFFSDVGVVNQLCRRGAIQPGGELFGKAFENWVFHELSAAGTQNEHGIQLSYWRLASGIEVDFVVGAMRVAIEAKATARVTGDDLRGLRQLAVDHPEVRRRFVVCLETKPRRTDEGIEILPVAEFVAKLTSGELFGDG